MASLLEVSWTKTSEETAARVALNRPRIVATADFVYALLAFLPASTGWSIPAIFFCHSFNTTIHRINLIFIVASPPASAPDDDAASVSEDSNLLPDVPSSSTSSPAHLKMILSLNDVQATLIADAVAIDTLAFRLQLGGNISYSVSASQVRTNLLSKHNH